MRDVENTPERLTLVGASPLFRPFFLGGLGFVVLGVSLLIFGALAHRSPSGDESSASSVGLGVFLTVFGFFVAIVPVVGRFPFRREIVVDRKGRLLIRHDRTLVRLRQDSYPLSEVRSVEVEESRHVDGDPYFALVLRLESGDAVTLDRFNDRSGAALAGRMIHDQLGSEHLSP